MAHHERRRSKHRRAGCMLGKRHKRTAVKKAGRTRAARAARRHEQMGMTTYSR